MADSANSVPASRVYFRRMNAFFPSAILGLACVMSACGDGKSEAAELMAAAADSAHAAAFVDLAPYHMPLVLEMPTGAPATTMVWKDATGKLAVRAGDHFAIEISEAPADPGRVKADLERDLLKRNTIIRETPRLLIYRSEFPDDTMLVFHHFDRWLTTDGRSFHVEDVDDGIAYTLEEVDRMAAAAHVKNPA